MAALGAAAGAGTALLLGGSSAAPVTETVVSERTVPARTTTSGRDRRAATTTAGSADGSKAEGRATDDDQRASTDPPSEAPEESPSAPAPDRPERQPQQGADDVPDGAGRLIVPPERRFSDTGDKLIGTITVTQLSVVKWSGTREVVVTYERRGVPVRVEGQSGRAGELVVPAAVYERVRVRSDGRWTISIAPSAEQGGVP